MFLTTSNRARNFLQDKGRDEGEEEKKKKKKKKKKKEEEEKLIGLKMELSMLRTIGILRPSDSKFQATIGPKLS